jgi:four helix bundle protein
MESQERQIFSELMRQRTKALAISVYELIRNIKPCEENREITRQLKRSATSVAANYSAATRSRSSQEFYSKLCIVVEECDETIFWLGFEIDCHILPFDEAAIVKMEATQIIKILSTSKKTLKHKLYRNPKK